MLVRNAMKIQLKAAFQFPPQTGAVALDRMVNAYNDYAQAAMAGLAAPTFTGSEKLVLKQALQPYTAAPVGSPIDFAQAWASGVLGYWVSPPVAFSGLPGPGTVTAFPGQPALVTALTVVFANLGNSIDRAAEDMSTALDTATKTVIVTLIPPVGPPVPTPLS